MRHRGQAKEIGKGDSLVSNRTEQNIRAQTLSATGGGWAAGLAESRALGTSLPGFGLDNCSVVGVSIGYSSRTA